MPDKEREYKALYKNKEESGQFTLEGQLNDSNKQ